MDNDTTILKLQKQLAVIRTYVSEEGQGTGSVSGQMVNTALDVIRDLFLATVHGVQLVDDQRWPDWVETKPTQPGLYLFRDVREWKHSVYTVAYGDWRLGQNPEGLYAGSMPITSFYIGYWLGPIPKSPGL